MKTKMFKLLFLIGLAMALSCRAVTGIIQPDSPGSEIDEPSSPDGTGVEDFPAGDEALDTEEAQDVFPEVDPDLSPTWTPEEPGDLGTVPEMPELPEMPEFQGVSPGTPFEGDVYRDVPVMEGAQNAAENSGTLTFYSDNSIEEVANYYEAAMPEQDWQVLTVSKEETSGTMLIYTKGDDVATIAILPDFMSDYETMVMIVVP